MSRPREALFVRPGDEGRGCEVHEWPDEGFVRRLVETMRATHGKGGINVCGDCIARAKRLAPEWCPVHQHYKWCTHNGGKLGPDGWGPPWPA
jgi:hypothetical protein